MLAAKWSTVPFSAAIVEGVERSPTRSSSGDHKKINWTDDRRPIRFLMIEISPVADRGGAWHT